MRSATLVLVLFVLFAGCASAQRTPPTDPAAFQAWALTIRVQDSAWMAFTTCGAQPMTWTNNEAIAEGDRDWIAEHEAEHRRHMASFGSCYAWHQWHSESWANDIETEARAFCASVRWATRTGRSTWLAALLKAAQWFSGYYEGRQWGMQEAAAALVYYCKP